MHIDWFKLRLFRRFWLVSGMALSLLLGMGFAASAQSEDPLAKPDVWKRLKENPSDEHPWKVYMGKDLFSLTKEEYAQYNKLKSHLLNLKAEENEKRELVMLKRREDYYDKRYGKKIQTEEYEELVQNIFKNFPIIEQYFDEQFKEQGETYKPYSVAHPDGQYSKVKWVEEHELKLLMLKEN